MSGRCGRRRGGRRWMPRRGIGGNVRDRRIDALAVEVLVAIGERDAAERRAGELLQTMIDREQLSLRQAVAWLGGTITVRGATRLLELAQPDENGRGSGERSAG